MRRVAGQVVLRTFDDVMNAFVDGLDSWLVKNLMGAQEVKQLIKEIKHLQHGAPKMLSKAIDDLKAMWHKAMGDAHPSSSAADNLSHYTDDISESTHISGGKSGNKGKSTSSTGKASKVKDDRTATQTSSTKTSSNNKRRGSKVKKKQPFRSGIPVLNNMDSNTLLVSKNVFEERRRSILLNYAKYLEKIEDILETFQMVGEGLKDKERVLNLSPEKPMRSADIRAEDSITYLHLGYSAGGDINLLKDFFLDSLQYWDEYGFFHERFHQITHPENIVSHMPLGDVGYWDAIRMTSFAILLGYTSELHRLCKLWDYSGQQLDGLLERLVAPYVPGRGTPPDECRNHLPYFKLLKVFRAEPELRPSMMKTYMEEWYEASRREPYHGSHLKGRDHNFLGYFSFETAAVAYVLDIDDSTFRDHEFYPKDMADFAKTLPRPDQVAARADSDDGIGLRCMGGEACPRAGYWFTPAKEGSRAYFKAGDIMPIYESDYGATIWQWDAYQG